MKAQTKAAKKSRSRCVTFFIYTSHYIQKTEAKKNVFPYSRARADCDVFAKMPARSAAGFEP